jgi:4-hydroxybenzoate polyprenyltransferase
VGPAAVQVTAGGRLSNVVWGEVVASVAAPDGLAAAPATQPAVTWLVFLRLRIFDELKDHGTDLKLNPGRPLPRGLISPGEAKLAAFAIAAAEAALACLCGLQAFAAWIVLLLYSLLMYREFFIGPWLRPRLELYAVAHTFAAGWTGLFVAVAVSGLALTALPRHVRLFALVNWALFSVYEFSRKTWAREEEREGRDSYSKRLGRGGAVALSTALAWAAAAIAFAPLGSGVSRTVPAVLFVFPALAAFPYLLRPRAVWAVTYRRAMQAYLFIFYVAAGLKMRS